MAIVLAMAENLELVGCGAQTAGLLLTAVQKGKSGSADHRTPIGNNGLPRSKLSSLEKTFLTPTELREQNQDRVATVSSNFNSLHRNLELFVH